MTSLLGIDTSNDFAGVFLYQQNQPLIFRINNQKNKHAEFLHLAIQDILLQAQLSPKNIDAFSILNGPGSYTGLRIGLASIKGLCYASKKPLIALSTLLIYLLSIPTNNNPIAVATIDARRDEVFIAIFNHHTRQFSLQPQAAILNPQLLSFFDNNLPITLIGSGAQKTQDFLNTHHLHNTTIHPFDYNAILNTFAQQSLLNFHQNQFANIQTLQPFYLKETFINPSKK